MLSRIAHLIVDFPLVYDVMSVVLGAHVSERFLRRQANRITANMGSSRLIADVGGGTARLRSIWQRDVTYVCLDVDRRKLSRANALGNVAIAADGRFLPFPDGSVDVVVSVAVSHHLTDESFDSALAEAARVLKPSGEIIFLDAVVRPRRWLSRVLWRWDRGAYPRAIETLEARLSRRFVVRHRDEFTWAHHYLVWAGSPVKQ